MLPPVTYLTTDSVSEGIGASQVLAYAERLATRGLDVDLHTFEKAVPTPTMREHIAATGIRWHPHPFGAFGARGGAARVAAGAIAIRQADLVHARSDLAAASALLARVPHWLWDVRSLWADQRIALGALRSGSAEHRVLQAIERRATRHSSAMVTLTEAVVPVLESRYGVRLRRKTTVIPTCVDTRRFTSSPLPPPDPVVVLLAGTLNAYYDVPLMVELVTQWQRRRHVQLSLITPAETPWDTKFSQLLAVRSTATFEQMPERVAAAHVGLSVCRSDAGVSLTASMPTKIAEFLATGRPVVVNHNLGDAGRLVEQHHAGVAVRAGDATSDVLDRLDELVEDPGTAARCRRLALEHFDLDHAIDGLVEAYERAFQN